MVALTLRAGVVAGVWAFRGLSPAQSAHLYDGDSYMRVAKAMLGDVSGYNKYHARVSPGFPALVAAVGATGLPVEYAAIGLNWASAAIAAALAAMVLNDRRIGLAVACLIPHYLMNSSFALSEAPMLALSMGGLLLATRGRPAGGAALWGLAGLIRPTACFLVLGWMVAMIARRRWRTALAGGAVAAGVVVAGMAGLQYWTGDAFGGVRYQVMSPNAYGGEFLTWPFKSLILGPLLRHVPPGRIAYIWLHAAVALWACIALLRSLTTPAHPQTAAPPPSLTSRARQQAEQPSPILLAVWLCGNTLFALSIGNVWGFECFHRFTVPAMPAMFVALAPILPRRCLTWAVVAGFSLVIAVATVYTTA